MADVERPSKTGAWAGCEVQICQACKERPIDPATGSPAMCRECDDEIKKKDADA